MFSSAGTVSPSGWCSDMATAQEHYAKLLAEHYVWMFGVPFEVKVSEQQKFLEPILADAPRGLALDLGCGPGFQSIALSSLGFAPVLAIDTSASLLSVLEKHRKGAAIQTLEHNLLEVDTVDLPSPAAVAVCMGDTLSHLPSKTAVSTLFVKIYQMLAPGGSVVLTYRDLSEELSGVDRYILVHSDVSRILTCFLEFVESERVMVHDLLHTLEDGQWRVQKGSYPKLRLSSAWVLEQLRAAGFEDLYESTAGRLLLIAAKRG